jgi:hypothetical protein
MSMKATSSLTDIYTNVLLSEGKKKHKEIKDEVMTKKENVVTKSQKIGDAKLVGDGPEKAKLPQKVTTLKRKKSMESYNSFEKLFKSTLNEENELEGPAPAASAPSMDFEVPTTGEEMADEIEDTEDEVSDLVSDLKDVVSKLNDILGKIGEETGEEEEELDSEEESPEDEFNYEEGEDEGEEEDETKSVKAESIENHGTPLVNARSGKDFEKKKKYLVGGKIKAKKGTAHTGKFTEEPEPKKMATNCNDLCNTKNSKVKTSNIKAGDFFK